MVTNKSQELKAISQSLTQYERALIELTELISDNATQPERVKTFAFMLELLAQALSGERKN